jgi:hypothetical protein
MLYDFTVVLSSGVSMTTVVANPEEIIKTLIEELPFLSCGDPMMSVGHPDYFPIVFRKGAVDGFTYALHDDSEDTDEVEEEASDDEELTLPEGMNV